MMLRKVVRTFESVDEFLKCDHSNESCRAVLSCSVDYCVVQYFQDPEESAAVEKTNNLFDAESPMFRKAIYTCIGLVALLTICGLIWEFAYWRPRQPKEAKTGEWSLSVTESL